MGDCFEDQSKAKLNEIISCFQCQRTVSGEQELLSSSQDLLSASSAHRVDCLEKGKKP